MKCQTIKKDVECFFMSVNGCTYNGGACSAIIEKCDGCEKAEEHSGSRYCIAYPNPDHKWQQGKCNLATHVKHEIKKEKIVNALKASKRKATGRM